VKIAVCVKQVPDTWSTKRLREEDATLDRMAAEGVLNELDEYAVEEALRLVEAHGGEVTIVTMGPQRAAETVRKAISMGADAGIHLCDDGLPGSDALATSYALACVLADRGFDLVLFGCESTDARMSVVPAMVAERLGWPQATFAAEVRIDGGDLTVRRQTESGTDTVTAQLPAVVSVVEKINEPRYPSFKGIMAAKKKPVATLSLAEAGIDAERVGLGAAWSTVADFAARPPRAQGEIVTDAGDGGRRIAEFLETNRLL